MKSNSKPVKKAVFAVVENPQDSREYLAVKRPEDDEDLPGVWGLPATSLGEEEDYEDALKRVGEEKLGVKLDIGQKIGAGDIEREKYVLHGEEYFAELLEGEPEVPQEGEPGTQYTATRWASGPNILREAADMGSLCCKIYLNTFESENYDI